MFVIPADLPPALVPLAFLIGSWVGEGVGGYPTINGFEYTQELHFRTNGKPYLEYSSRTWDKRTGTPFAVETGYWRPQPDGALEVVLAHPTGVVEVYVGTVTGQKVELVSDVVARTTSAKEVTASHRLYGIVEGGDLAYAIDMAAVGQALQPHLSARLLRVDASGDELGDTGEGRASASEAGHL